MTPTKVKQKIIELGVTKYDSGKISSWGWEEVIDRTDLPLHTPDDIPLCYVDQIEFPQKLKFRKNHYLRIKINCRVI